MRVAKEAELNAAILHFIAKCLAEGDHQTLSDLGLDCKDAEAIESLYLTDVDHLGSVNFPLLRKGSIDRDLFRRLIGRIRDLREHKSVRDELLARDAPFPMMHEQFGMDAGEYAERGRRIAVLRRRGRPAEPREDEGSAVWRAYEALDKPKDQPLSSEEYLILCKTTGLSARTVWTVMHRLLAAQDPAATRSPQRKEGPQPMAVETKCGDQRTAVPTVSLTRALREPA